MNHNIGLSKNFVRILGKCRPLLLLKNPSPPLPSLPFPSLLPFRKASQFEIIPPAPPGGENGTLYNPEKTTKYNFGIYKD